MAVLVGLIGTQLGASWQDGIAAVIVGVMVGKIGASLAWEASRELIDTALPREQQHAMRECLLTLPEVRGAHDLRSRTLADRIVLEVHLLVAPRISVSEGHAIGHHAVARLKAQFPQLSDVLYHIDPEDDSQHAQASLAQPTRQQPLPLRHDIIAALDQCWQQSPLWQARSGLTLHYVHHATESAESVPSAPHVDILLELPSRTTETALQCYRDADARNASISQMERLAADLEWFGRLSIGVTSHIHQH